MECVPAWDTFCFSENGVPIRVSTFYSPLVGVPHRYAIVSANRYMIETSDTVICYVSHFGNARNLLEYARKQEGKRLICVENLSSLG